VDNQYNVCQCQYGTCSTELHTKQWTPALWLPISCLLIVTVAENIKGLTLIAHLCNSWVHSTYYTRHLLSAGTVLSRTVVILRMTGLEPGTVDTVSSNWPGKQTSSHEGTGSPDIRMFSQRGLSLRHAKETRISFSICKHQHKTLTKWKSSNITILLLLISFTVYKIIAASQAARHDQLTWRDADFNVRAKFCFPFWHLPRGIDRRDKNLS